MLVEQQKLTSNKYNTKPEAKNIICQVGQTCYARYILYTNGIDVDYKLDLFGDGATCCEVGTCSTCNGNATYTSTA